MSKPLSWKPIRHGNVYCSPACGRGCTIEEYEDACKEAAKISSKLPGFKPRVTENLGWYASAEALDGRITVSRHGDTYMALANEKHRNAGNSEWGCVDARSAKKAVEKLKDKLRVHVVKLATFLNELDYVSSSHTPRHTALRKADR